MAQAVPPSHPEITDADRNELRTRLQALFVERSLSGRQVEDRLNLGGGTLSKVYAGKMQLTHKLLAGLSGLLGASPEDIVRETGFVRLLETPVPTQEGDELARAKAEIDRLRVDGEAREASLKGLREELTTARNDAEEQRRVAAKLELECAATKTKVEAKERELAQAAEERRAAQKEVRSLREQLAAEMARSAAHSETAEKWRKYALEQKQLAEQLTEYSTNLQGQVERESKAKAQAAIGTGLLAFTIGALMNSKD